MDNTNTQPNTTPTEQAVSSPVTQATPPVVTSPTPESTLNAAPVTPSGNNKKMFVILGLVTLLLLVAGAGAWWMVQNTSTKSLDQAMIPKPSVAPTATPMPSKTEVEEVDAVDTNEDLTKDFADVEKDVSSL